jgi:hypothetical protein
MYLCERLLGLLDKPFAVPSQRAYLPFPLSISRIFPMKEEGTIRTILSGKI